MVYPINIIEPLTAGVDEVGRGALFGPVVAAAVILPEKVLDDLASPLASLYQGGKVADSKKLTKKRRCILASQIQTIALDCQIGIASVREIDRLNILQASLLAMKRAVLRLKYRPNLVLVDGNQQIQDLSIPQKVIVKGDSKCLAIAAASIVAKVWRDTLIIRLAKKYPVYDLTNNKGYGTSKHKQGILNYGLSPQHRLSFSPCQLSLFTI
ncbi:MAG: ribonuclease HII [Okeania sp. SIO3B5]|uniref:ribonuclease HII n=1 Tax=Okeania sp. SIO3B5 TaxID=2607811 RepID=UPI001400B466|nr:ribonuclease HII [Okeania sp. SIO3B5]NEO51844.1 ribonuclease HII [Okeania sp. SIO3B5]